MGTWYSSRARHSTVSLRRDKLFGFVFPQIHLVFFLKYCHVHIRFYTELYSHTSLINCYLLLYIMLFIGYHKTLRVTGGATALVGGACSPFFSPAGI